ncbi:TRAP transporter small permease [Acidimangrovimonas sediminis]|uniref:TRAP transporter small permease n=1 Tax=Acidimangrovimonas sediminis TaxID=2056283 RepID=UPI0018ED6A9E|nr:TRAP transporter small permease subunit [Acidimangrovimonas sediminis]
MLKPYPTLGPVSRLLDGVTALIVIVSGVMMVVLIAIFGWLVFGRYVLNNTPTWVEQVSLLLVVWITFLGAGVGVRQKLHLSTDFMRDALPTPASVPLTYLTHVAMIFLGGLMA